MSSETYSVIRHYFDDAVPNRTIKTGLSLEEAQAHCQREDTSSSSGGVDPRTDGPWFDGYEAER